MPCIIDTNAHLKNTYAIDPELAGKSEDNNDNAFEMPTCCNTSMTRNCSDSLATKSHKMQFHKVNESDSLIGD